MMDELQAKLPESFVEKASKAELLALLERHEVCVLELEQQQLALGTLQQQVRGILQDRASPGPGEEPPILQEISAVQDRCLR
jgi:nesprin-1